MRGISHIFITLSAFFSTLTHPQTALRGRGGCRGCAGPRRHQRGRLLGAYERYSRALGRGGRIAAERRAPRGRRAAALAAQASIASADSEARRYPRAGLAAAVAGCRHGSYSDAGDGDAGHNRRSGSAAPGAHRDGTGLGAPVLVGLERGFRGCAGASAGPEPCSAAASK